MADLHWATSADIDRVLPLVEEYHRQEGLKGHSRDRLKAVLEGLLENPHRGRVLLATHGADTVGYALVVRRPSFEWASDLAVLDEIFIQGRAREHGLGRRMIAFVESYAASEGLPQITLEVAAQNFAAREFYRAVGFYRIDREIYCRNVNGPR